MTLLKFGAVWKQEPYASETWRLATAMFLHSGFQHLLFNMFALFVFAPRWNASSAPSNMPCCICSAACWAMRRPCTCRMGTLAVGASGAIYGVYGAYLFIAIFQRWALDQASRKTIMIILGIGIVQSFVITGISWSAHLGGLAAGFVLYAILQRIRS